MRFNLTMLKKILPLLFVLAVVHSSLAQFTQEDKFGKNRVQYKNFHWRYITTTNFDIYYYDGGYEIAKLAANIAEQEFNRITDLIGHSPFYKTKIFLYNSVIDLRQSNIGVNQQGIEVGGQTNFVRSEIEVAFTGLRHTFKQELTHGIADMFIFDMMYGGNLKEVLQSSYLLNLPEWFMAGAAKYVAEGWNVELDDYMRDMLSNRKFKRPEILTDKEAKLVGQAIWNYVAEEYGSANISNILNLIRIVRNEEVSIQQTLGVSYKSFMEGWKTFYLKQLSTLSDQLTLPSDEAILFKNNKKYDYNKVKFSPDGHYLAYTTNFQGKYKVTLVDLPNNKSKVLLRGGYKVINQKIDNNIPLVEWRANSDLAIFSPKNGKNYLWLVNISKKRVKRKKRHFSDFSQIKEFSISKGGNMIVMVGERRGKSDLYLHDIRGRRTQQITNDGFDYLGPQFLGSTDKIVFSSNRVSDTLKKKEENLKEISSNFNLFVLDRKSPKVLSRLTNTLSRDIKPLPINENEVVFLSDQRGIYQLYKYNLQDSISTQLTNYKLSIQDYDIVGDQIAMVMYKGGKEQIYHMDHIDLNTSNFTNKTYRQQVLDLRYLQTIKRKRALEEQKKKLEEAQKKREEEAQIPKKEEEKTAQAKPQLADDEVDTDNYQFDTFAKEKKQSFLDRYKARLKSTDKDDTPKEVKISRPKPYENQFTVDNFVTSLLIDPLRDWGLLFEVAMTDVMENHKINAGLYGLINLKNSNFYGEYQYLKGRLDYGLRYERYNLERTGEAIAHEYSLNHLQASVSYPFNITSRVTLSPFYASTRFTNTDISQLAQPDQTDHYAGAKAEFTFDNSLVTGTNMLQGTRAKIKVEHYFGLKDSEKGFGNLLVDIRHYQKLHKSIIFATRLSYGQFFGNAEKTYRLGGTSNWMFADMANEEEVNVQSAEENRSDLLFTKFATPLRGFDFNHWSGANYMLLNAELRIPLLKYFYRGTITSNFFRDLQIVGFTDIGSSWTGISPFNKENSLNTDYVNSGNFNIKVSNFKNPFLVGYGAGIRTTMLGYYVKFDVAWGVEDKVRSDAKFYLSLGHDF
ncbi:translocation protein TolB [Rapidithrix thailandica]|uniref:Translocation protein TolB n=1 Tax=Rapidithrix thailandica TaxID=413964 RepID=A0AAW9SF42_9BACT